MAIGPIVKDGFVSTTFYQHEATLRLMMRVLGLTTFPGDAATAPDMREFFLTGIAPAVSLSPTSLTFASQQVGTTSAAQGVTLSNTGNATLNISGIALEVSLGRIRTFRHRLVRLLRLESSPRILYCA